MAHSTEVCVAFFQSKNYTFIVNAGRNKAGLSMIARAEKIPMPSKHRWLLAIFIDKASSFIIRKGVDFVNNEQTGKLIASYRKRKNMTQQELADALGVTNRAISKWETGRGVPDISILENLSRILGISIDALVRGDDLPTLACDEEPREKTALFQCKNKATPGYCRRLAKLKTAASFPARPALLAVGWAALMVLFAGMAALRVLYPGKKQLLLFLLLPLLILIVLLVLGHGWDRLWAQTYRHRRCQPENKGGEILYRFTDAQLQIQTVLDTQLLSYDSISTVAFTGSSMLLFSRRRDVFLLESGDFEQGNLQECLAFLRERCPSARFRQIREAGKKRDIIGYACLITALLPTGLQAVVRFLGPHYQVSYSRDFYSILIALLSILLLTAGGLLLLLGRPKKLGAAGGITLAVAALGIILISPPVESTSTISTSGSGNALILKTDQKSGKTSRCRSLAPLLVMHRENLPYTADEPFKLQWLTDDVCAVTYTSPDDGETHQYVATYGDRSDGISYYWVGAALQGSWSADTVDSAGWALEIGNGEIRIGDGAGLETFASEDCIQFGTTALVLCKNGRPVWTLAMGEDCRMEGGTLQPGGSVIACRVSMERTAPLVFSSHHSL